MFIHSCASGGWFYSLALLPSTGLVSVVWNWETVVSAVPSLKPDRFDLPAHHVHVSPDGTVYLTNDNHLYALSYNPVVKEQ